jgi:4-hydroxyphenylpyruvate dioxygenase-like putative hemolysin
MSEANVTGVIEIVLALDPNDLSNPPHTSMQIAKFTMDKNTDAQNVISKLGITINNSQIVNTNMSVYTITAVDTVLKVNPVSPTATPVVTAGPNATATAVPVITSTPASSPDCKSCSKRKCDNVCDPKRDGVNCPDCLYFLHCQCN